MKTGNYLCKLCDNEFEPTRRGVQKFCSSTCRKKYSYHKNKTATQNVKKSKSSDVVADKNKKTKVEEMSLQGVGNAFTGALAANVVSGVAKNAFKRKSDMPATKGDIEEIKEMIEQRYFQIHNMQSDVYGRIAYFDLGTCKIVYFDQHLNQFVEP